MSETRLELREALDIVADGGPTLDASDIEALRVIVHFAIDHMDCRRVLSVPTEEIPSEMIEAAAEGILDRMGMHEHTLNEWNKAIAFARAALSAAFDTLGIQEKET
jgi:predicted transcriptional regulator